MVTLAEAEGLVRLDVVDDGVGFNPARVEQEDGRVMNTVRVLVVDDHPVVRAGLTALLSAQPAIQVVGQAADGYRAVELAAELRPDVVLCDLRLGDGPDGVEVARTRPTPPCSS